MRRETDRPKTSCHSGIRRLDGTPFVERNTLCREVERREIDCRRAIALLDWLASALIEYSQRGGRLRRRGLEHRLHFHASNFLEEPLPAADMLVMGHILMALMILGRTPCGFHAENSCIPESSRSRPPAMQRRPASFIAAERARFATRCWFPNWCSCRERGSRAAQRSSRRAGR